MPSSSLHKNLVRLSPIATIVALSFACGSEGGPSDGAGGTQGSTGGASTTGGAANVGGTSNSGGATNPTGGATSTGGSTNPTGGATNTGGGSVGGGANESGGGPGTGGGASETAADCSSAEGEVPPLKLTEVVGGLDNPVYALNPPGDDRLFVITLTGTVRIVKDGTLLPTPFLDLGDKVQVGGGAGGDETGLLGIAFHPEYATNGLFYLHYSDGNDPNSTGDSIVEEYKVSDSADVADAASGRLVLKVEQPSNGGSLRNHKGGSIAFGSDGLLYIGLGDGGGSGDTQGNGQKLTTLLGKILRINPLAEGGSPYTSPPGNLKDTVSEALPEIWDYGLRNPFRFTFDLCNGDLYIGDVGQNLWEEINIEKAGDGHHNYGWNRMEGLHCYSPSTNCDMSGITLPLIEIERADGRSISGGAVYRGSSIPGLRGAYFYADYATNLVWYAYYDRDAGTVSDSISVTQELNPITIVAITNGNDGELYFTSFGQFGATPTPGAIYKLEAAD